MKTPGRRERGLKVGQAGASTQNIRLVGGRGKDLRCFPWSEASQTGLSIGVSAHNYCFPQETETCASAKLPCLQKNYTSVSMIP